MFPNTFMMQELVRGYFDEYIERQEEGETVETPYIYTIAKGINNYHVRCKPPALTANRNTTAH